MKKLITVILLGSSLLAAGQAYANDNGAIADKTAMVLTIEHIMEKLGLNNAQSETAKTEQNYTPSFGGQVNLPPS